MTLQARDYLVAMTAGDHQDSKKVIETSAKPDKLQDDTVN